MADKKICRCDGCRGLSDEEFLSYSEDIDRAMWERIGARMEEANRLLTARYAMMEAIQMQGVDLTGSVVTGGTQGRPWWVGEYV